MKINNTVFLSYLRCPYKACLLLEGRSGQRTAYETLIAAQSLTACLRGVK